jgi:hypothetical protein
MGRKLFFLCLLVSLGGVGMSQNYSKLKSSAKALKNNDFPEARAILFDLLPKSERDALTNFELALYFSDSLNPADKNLFYAYYYIQIAFENSKKLTAEDIQNCNKIYEEFRGMFTQKVSIIESNLLKQLKTQNNVDDIIKFLYFYPNSNITKDVRTMYSKIVYDICLKANTISSWNDFIERFPNSNEINDAFKARNLLAFNVAKNSDRVSSFTDFIEYHQEDKQLADKAIELRYKLAYEKYSKQYTTVAEIDQLDWFIKYFYAPPPNMPNYTDSIITLKNRLEFVKARETNTIEALQSYIYLHPNRPQVRTAALMRDSLVYLEVKKENEKNPTLNEFLSNYPGAKQAFNSFLENYRCKQTYLTNYKILTKVAFEWAKCKNDIPAFQNFIQTYKDSEQYEEATRILNEMQQKQQGIIK